MDTSQKQHRVKKALKKAPGNQLTRSKISRDVFTGHLSATELDELLASLAGEVEETPHPEKPDWTIWRLLSKEERRAKAAATKKPIDDADESEIFEDALLTCGAPYRRSRKKAEEMLTVLRKRGMPWFFGRCRDKQDTLAMFEALNLPPEELAKILYETRITRDQFADLFDCTSEDADKAMRKMEERYGHQNYGA